MSSEAQAPFERFMLTLEQEAEISRCDLQRQPSRLGTLPPLPSARRESWERERAELERERAELEREVQRLRGELAGRVVSPALPPTAPAEEHSAPSAEKRPAAGPQPKTRFRVAEADGKGGAALDYAMIVVHGDDGGDEMNKAAAPIANALMLREKYRLPLDR
eukprot:gene23192-30874_t